MRERPTLGEGVDISDLIERLHRAPPCQLLTILDAVERVVWASAVTAGA